MKQILPTHNFIVILTFVTFFVKDVFTIPSELSYESAVSIGDSYATALLGLARRADLKKDQTVLVTAAAGGLGLAAVDIAANLCKAKVKMLISYKLLYIFTKF